MKFAPEYVTSVLNDNFEDAKELLLSPLMAINYAHLVMLAEQGIISATDARALRTALDGISLDSVREVLYDGTYEDLFFYIERLIKQSCDDEIAGRLHTARSRNDIDMTMYRMRQREFIAAVAAVTMDLREALLALAERHKETVYGAHTHTQPAQPTTVAHYLLAVIEQLERDNIRLNAAYESTNRNPLGSCAITGTGFAIDRNRTSELLGFRAPTGNTYGSIATVDYLLEGVSATSILVVGLGRVIQDLLLWCTMEFGYLRLSDGFVQGSSIMPQKRNPVALEHARAIASQGRRPGPGHRHHRAQHAVRRYRRYRRRSAAAHRLDVSGCHPHGVARCRCDAPGGVRCPAAGIACGRRRHHVDRAGRHAGSRSRLAVSIGARHCRPAVESADGGSGRGALRGAVESVDGHPRAIARLQ